MIRLLADENIDSDLIRGLQRRVASLDIARVQDVGLRTFDDAAILRWAADQGRALVSHDLKTIPAFAFDRVARGLPMPGVFAAPKALALSAVIDDLALVATASSAEEWFGRVVYLPLR